MLRKFLKICCLILVTAISTVPIRVNALNDVNLQTFKAENYFASSGFNVTSDNYWISGDIKNYANITNSQYVSLKINSLVNKMYENNSPSGTFATEWNYRKKRNVVMSFIMEVPNGEVYVDDFGIQSTSEDNYKSAPRIFANFNYGKNWSIITLVYNIDGFNEYRFKDFNKKITRVIPIYWGYDTDMTDDIKAIAGYNSFKGQGTDEIIAILMDKQKDSSILDIMKNKLSVISTDISNEVIVTRRIENLLIDNFKKELEKEIRQENEIKNSQENKKLDDSKNVLSNENGKVNRANDDNKIIITNIDLPKVDFTQDFLFILNIQNKIVTWFLSNHEFYIILIAIFIIIIIIALLRG